VLPDILNELLKLRLPACNGRKRYPGRHLVPVGFRPLSPSQRDHADSHGEAWAFLRALDPDIALLQEAVLPVDISDTYRLRWTRAWEGKPWGSAILSRAGDLVPDWEDSSRGAVLVAHCSIPSLGRFSLASLHARIVDRRLIPALRQTFAALRPHLGGRFIVGGDLNTARAAARAWPENGHAEFWNTLDASEFKDCYYTLHGVERQSYWREWLRNKPPTIGNSLMDDHVFVDAETIAYLTDCLVWDTKEIRELSDHGPVVVDLALPGEGG